tara:strand:+ start:489 stop:692 length:204 start_codon:yes stop_codon:yes gene_type:complete
MISDRDTKWLYKRDYSDQSFFSNKLLSSDKEKRRMAYRLVAGTNSPATRLRPAALDHFSSPFNVQAR